MAKLVIKDLTDSVELDRQAMAAIVGGARIGAHAASVAVQVVPGSARVVEYPRVFPQRVRLLPVHPLPQRCAICRAARAGFGGSQQQLQRHALTTRAVCV